MSMQKDPLLSGAMNTSPIKGSPLNPAGGGGLGMFGGHPPPQPVSGLGQKLPGDSSGMVLADQSQEDVSTFIVVW